MSIWETLAFRLSDGLITALIVSFSITNIFYKILGLDSRSKKALVACGRLTQAATATKMFITGMAYLKYIPTLLITFFQALFKVACFKAPTLTRLDELNIFLGFFGLSKVALLFVITFLTWGCTQGFPAKLYSILLENNPGRGFLDVDLMMNILLVLLGLTISIYPPLGI